MSLTVQKHQTDETANNCQPLNYEHERYIEWCAAKGQLLYDLESHRVVKRPALALLARELGVSRQTLYEWPQRIKAFDSRVEKAKQGIIIANSIAVWNAVFLKACSGDFKTCELYLANFDPNFISPRYKALNAEPQKSGLMDLLEIARKRSASEKDAITE